MLPAVRWTGGEIGDYRYSIGSGQSIGRLLQRGDPAGAAGTSIAPVAAFRRRDLTAPAGPHRNTYRPVLARAHHDGVSPRESAGHAIDRGRLVIPFDEIADHLALAIRRMDPVNKWPAFGLGHRPGGADDKDRCAVEISVIDAHRRAVDRPGCARLAIIGLPLARA